MINPYLETAMNTRTIAWKSQPAKAAVHPIGQATERMRFALGVAVAVTGVAIGLSNLARLLA